jgi:hypothetical protein
MVHLVKIYFIIMVQTSETDCNYEEICSMKLICLVSHKVDTVILRKQVEVHQRLFLGHPEKMETSSTFEMLVPTQSVLQGVSNFRMSFYESFWVQNAILTYYYYYY